MKKTSNLSYNKTRRNNLLFTLIFLLFLFHSCTNKISLKAVSVKEFTSFVEETGYITDAEKYGWSVVQTSVFGYKVVEGANWRKPDGIHAISAELPVTQVSYNDAIAYCGWAGTRLPTYEEYWAAVQEDQRTIVSDQLRPISPVDEVNIVGNVWDITQTTRKGQVRLAGGSIFCSENTCHGTQPEREFFVDKETGNIHIGFSVIRNE